MKIAFLVDPVASLNPKKDSSIAMMREAVGRGHAVFAFELRDLVADRALADAQFQRRAGEVEMARGRFEGAQGVERQLGAVHGRNP